jgi:hypothetical protein
MQNLRHENHKTESPASPGQSYRQPPPRRHPREDMNQIAYRVMQETIRRSEEK